MKKIIILTSCLILTGCFDCFVPIHDPESGTPKECNRDATRHFYSSSSFEINSGE